MQSEIFRHLRPKWYNRKNNEIIPDKFGGISFLLKPIADKTYHFWLYYCPRTAIFSAKQAVKTLRNKVTEDIVPFGTIVLDDTPLIDQLARFLIKEQMVLPSDVAKYALEIIIANSYAEKKYVQKNNLAKTCIEKNQISD